MSDLTQLTIHEAGALLRRRQVSSAELTRAALDRIEETEPLVHAYATVLGDSARKEAAQADRELAGGLWRGPLHGIPLGIKDLCYTRGVPTEAGSRVLEGFVPAYDATVVELLRTAGAVTLGKTVTHEFAYGQNVPPTKNPWNLDFYPGGSSAGSGVATAVGSAFGAIGSDTGGSIRVPASINALAGLKPTFGRVSRRGVVALSSSLAHVGPIARDVEDCALLLQAIAGHDPLDAASLDRPVPDFTARLQAGAGGFRLGVDRGYYFSDAVCADVRSTAETALRELERLGATLVDVSIPEMELALVVGLTILQVEASTIHRELLRSRGADYDLGTRLMLEVGEFIPATHYALALRARRVVQAAVRDTFQAERLDALVGPTLPLPTVKLDDMLVDFLGGGEGIDLSAMLKHGIIANVSGLPALTIPCGMSGDGFPIGLQFIGRPFAEASLFTVARAYEAATEWHTMRPDLSLVQAAAG
jgi:aspartyl-tRNA(Asn)/glutamyl-tRNA(Gln) amidotransferase subunit A